MARPDIRDSYKYRDQHGCRVTFPVDMGPVIAVSILDAKNPRLETAVSGLTNWAESASQSTFTTSMLHLGVVTKILVIRPVRI